MTGEACNEERLAAYAAGACSGEEADGIRAHLLDCPSCRAWLDEAGSNEAIAGNLLEALDAYAATPPAALDDETGDEALLGQKIGQFLVERVIARGGMGTVYLATQDRPRRPVALKVMRASLLSRSARRRFEYESQVLARLRHPNIAQVYEAGVAEVSRQPSAISRQPTLPLRFGPGSISSAKTFSILNTRARLTTPVPCGTNACCRRKKEPNGPVGVG